MAEEEDFEELVKTVFSTIDESKYNISLGFFQSYDSVDADASGVRFCQANLHNKDSGGSDIGIIKIPLLYIGTPRVMFDYSLEKGDDLAIFFTDKSLEQWKSEKEPQKLDNPVKDSINHAFAIPVVSHKYTNDLVTTSLPSDVAGKISVDDSKKIQIGNNTEDLLKILYDVLTELTGPAVQNSGAAATPSPLINQAQLLAIQTRLATITKF